MAILFLFHEIIYIGANLLFSDEKPVTLPVALVRLIKGLKYSHENKLKGRLQTLFDTYRDKNPEEVKEEILDILDDVNEDVKIKLSELEKVEDFSEEDEELLRKVDSATRRAMRGVDRMQPKAIVNLFANFHPLLVGLLEDAEGEQQETTTVDEEMATEMPQTSF